MGIVKDVAAQDVPADHWSDGTNIIFEDGQIRKSYGYEVELGITYEPTAILYVTDGNNDYWAFGDASGVEVWDGATFTDITPVGWGAGIVTMTDINGFLVVNNSLSGLYYWDFGVILLAYPDWQPTWTAQVIRAHRNNLFALNVEDGTNYRGGYGRWSDVAAPGNVPQIWQPAADNLAGDFQLPTPEGKIIDGLTLRRDFLIYKENSVHIARFAGSAFVYKIDDLFESMGLLARGCVVENDNLHYCVTQDDVVAHDGVQIQSIIDGVMKHYLFDNINPDLADLTYMTVDRNSEQIYLAFPDKLAAKGCNRMLIYSYTDKTWTERVFQKETLSGAVGRYTDTSANLRTWATWADTWASSPGVWNPNDQPVSKNRVIIGAIDELWKLAAVDSDGGVSIPVNVEKTGIILGANDVQKFIPRIWPRFSEGDGVTVQMRVGAAANVEQSPVWGPIQNFTIGVDRSLPVEAQGRAMAIRVSSSGDGHWALNGIDFDVRPQGRF